MGSVCAGTERQKGKTTPYKTVWWMLSGADFMIRAGVRSALCIYRKRVRKNWEGL